MVAASRLYPTYGTAWNACRVATTPVGWQPLGVFIRPTGLCGSQYHWLLPVGQISRRRHLTKGLEFPGRFRHGQRQVFDHVFLTTNGAAFAQFHQDVARLNAVFGFSAFGEQQEG